MSVFIRAHHPREGGLVAIVEGSLDLLGVVVESVRLDREAEGGRITGETIRGDENSRKLLVSEGFDVPEIILQLEEEIEDEDDQ